MRFHTYSKFSPELADAVDLQSLLEKLADFLLQSGFAGGRMSHPYWGDFGGDADRSLEALKEAILNALIESGQFTPEMLQALRETGWHNYSLFMREDGMLFGYLETPDFERARRGMAGREVNVPGAQVVRIADGQCH